MRKQSEHFIWIFALSSSLERSQGAASLVDSHAEVRTSSLLSQPEDPWTELPHPRGNKISKKQFNKYVSESVIAHFS